MKRIRMLGVALSLLLMAPPVLAADACASLLCMAGKLHGQPGGPECHGPISDYFSILKFGRRGRFDAGRTASARLGFLTSCPSDVGDWPSRINSSYGTLRSLGL
jgi:TrbM